MNFPANAELAPLERLGLRDLLVLRLVRLVERICGAAPGRRYKGRLARAWQELVVFLVRPRAWDVLNTAVYQGLPEFGEASWSRGLFEWEREAVRGYFPDPPAPILVMAAGGGREVMALAADGYPLFALEPCPKLAKICRRAVVAPHLAEVLELTFRQFIRGIPAELQRPFAAVVIGWGSASYVSTLGELECLIQAVRRICPNGPILLSYLSDPDSGRLRRLFQALFRFAGWPDYCFQTRYWMGLGISRNFTTAQIAQLAANTGNQMQLVHQARRESAAMFLPVGRDSAN